MAIQTQEQKDWEASLEEEIRNMSPSEMMDFIPEEVLRLIAKGFLAGMRGPKKYEKNNWMTLDLDAETDIWPSFHRHIRQWFDGGLDPDTGMQYVEPFIMARSIMFCYFSERNRANNI